MSKKTSRLIASAKKLCAPFRVTDGAGFRLKDHDPANTGSLKSKDKPRAREALEKGIDLLAGL